MNDCPEYDEALAAADSMTEAEVDEFMWALAGLMLVSLLIYFFLPGAPSAAWVEFQQDIKRP